MPAGANADPATNIVSTSADLNGTIAGADPGDQYQFSFGTTPGGPYPTFPILQPSPSPAADGAVTQNTGNQLSPNTTYYFVVTTYDSLNNVIAISNEQSFTTLSVSIESCNDVNCQCATCLIAGETSAVTCLVAYGNTNTNWYYVQRWGTTPGGPYPNTSVPPNTNFAQGTDPDGDVSYQPPGTFPSGTQIYYVWEMYDDNNVLQDTSPECTFNTVQPYSVACDPATNITQTSADLQGTITDMPSSIAYQFIWGTTPGGPYPNTTGLLPGPGAGAQPVFQNIAGLTPNTTYYYKVESRVGTNNVEKQSTECQFTTLPVGPPVRTAQCDPASAITDTSATLNGTLGNIQPGDQYQIRYGTTPGGPYGTTLGPAVAANGAVSQNAAGLTPSTNYYFIVEVLDNTLAVVATSGECTFATAAAPPPARTAVGNPATAVTPVSATFNGTLGNVQPGDTYRFRYGPTGGPYGTTVGPFPANNGPVSQPVAGLTPNTQYCYIVEVLDAGAAVVATSPSEVCFTTPAVPPGESADCTGATNIDPNSATLNGVLHNATPGYLWNFEAGTNPGGPYPFVTAPQGVAAGGDPEPISSPSGPIPTGSTIYYRVRVTDALNNLQYTSGECSFVTPLAPNATCGGASSITSNSADLNVVITGANFPGWNYIIRYGTAPGGPYPSSIGPIAVNSDPQSEPQSTGPVLSPNTQYYWIVELYDGLMLVDTSSECNFVTQALPVTVTTDPPTGQNADCVTLNGTSQNAAAGNCTYSFIWGTTPGGPYPNTVNGTPFVSSGASPEAFSAQVCGLGPNATIYYKAQVKCGANPPVIGDEVPANTTEILFDPCEAATAITPVSAVLHATSTGVPPGYSYRFRYGTTPGGPYPSTVAAGIATGASPEGYQAPVANLTPCTTYYYIAEVLNAQQQVVAQAGECTFTSGCAAGPDGFVYWCGALYDSANCTFVPDNAGEYYGDDDVPGGYYYCAGADPVDE